MSYEANAVTNAAEQWIALGKIGRPYGLTGALHVYPYSTDAQTLLDAVSLRIGGADFVVRKARRHGESIVVTLAEIESPEAAARLVHVEVSVKRDSFAALTEGEYYWVDLIGLECCNGERSFGQVVEIFESGAHPILRTRLPDSSTEELIPYVDAIIRSVDLNVRRIDVDWQGLD